MLLRHAMQSAQPPYQVSTIYAHHLAPRKYFRENIESYAIGSAIKRWNEYKLIRNVKIRVARRKALALKHNWRRHRQFNNLERLAFQISRRFQAIKVLSERQMVFIC